MNLTNEQIQKRGRELRIETNELFAKAISYGINKFEKLQENAGKSLWMTEYTLSEEYGIEKIALDVIPTEFKLDESLKTVEIESDYACLVNEKRNEAIKKAMRVRSESGKFLKKGARLLKTNNGSLVVFDNEADAWNYYIVSKEDSLQTELYRQVKVNEALNDVAELKEKYMK